MRDRFLDLVARAAVERPRAVIAGALALTLVAGALVPGLRVSAGHRALSGPDDPHVVRMEEFLERFGSPGQLVVLVEGGSEELRRKVTGRLEHVLPGPKDGGAAGDAGPAGCEPEGPERQAGCVRDVVQRVPIDRFVDHALFFLPEDASSRVVDLLAGDDLGVRALLRLDGLAAAFDALASLTEKRTGEAKALEGDEKEKAKSAMDGLARFLDVLRGRVERDEPPELSLAGELLASGGGTRPEAFRGLDAHGHLSSSDGGIKLALVRPLDETDKPRPVLAFVGYVERHAREAATELGRVCSLGKSACPDGPLRVSFTGLPALIADEARTLEKDLGLTSLVAFAGVALLFAVGFRSISLAALGLLPLLLAIVWTLAFVRVAFGDLNMLTASFVSTLIGLGIDFSVHLLARYQEARSHGQRTEKAARVAVAAAGPGLLTGALTTAGAFFALAPCDFKAFRELGVMTGAGLLLALLATLFLLPALLVLPSLKRFQPKIEPVRPEAAHVRGLPESIVAWPRAILAFGLAAAVFMGLQGGTVRWSYDYTALLAADLPSVQAWDRLRERTDRSAEAAAIVARSAEEALDFQRRLEAKATVARVESAVAFLPGDQAFVLRAFERLRPLFDGGDPAPAKPPEKGAVLASLQVLLDALEDARFEAKRGHAEEAALLDPPISALHRLQRSLEARDDAEVARRLAPLQAELLDLRDRVLGNARRMAAGEPLTPDDLLATLPAGLRERLFHDGEYALYVYPSKPIGDREFRAEFVRDLRDVSDTATGFPVNQWEHVRAIEVGFRQASVYASIAVVLLLLLDFRRIGATLLALLPLAIGLAFAWGGMGLLGMHYNPANIIAFPLVVGIGVDTGVHILHRYRQDRGRDLPGVIRHTGRAIFLSTATTIAGFGSLAFATHRGMASLGVVLVIGVGACLAAAVAVLPAVLTLVGGLRASGRPPA